MTSLKQMGRYCFLIGKCSKRPLCLEQKLYPSDSECINKLMINGVIINSDCFNDLERLENYVFSIEKCDNMPDLLLLTKMDFEKECDIKEYLFGKSFENLDCPKLTSCFLRSITLSQTFNDDFTFVGRTGEIPCSKLWGDVSRPVKEVLPPCVLA